MSKAKELRRFYRNFSSARAHSLQRLCFGSGDAPYLNATTWRWRPPNTRIHFERQRRFISITSCALREDSFLAHEEPLKILEVSSPEVDPRFRKQFVTILDRKWPEQWTREHVDDANQTTISTSTTSIKDDPSATGSTTRSRESFLYEYGLKHFLPAQYPHSVPDGYAPYAAYSFGASIAGSAAMVLSTQTLLLAVGVVGSGSSQASVLAGALNWVLKDGVGQLGGVLYASAMGRTRRFDANPKRWRMMAALCLDAGTLLEILSPYAAQSSGLVLPLACLANVLKNIGFLTASASRASLHQAMAIKGNLGDVTAKAGSQATAAGLGGTSVGIAISTLFSSGASVETFVVAFCFLSFLHQVGNYLSVQAVPLSHFNLQRVNILLENYCKDIGREPQNAFQPNTKALSPQDVAARESFLPWISDSQANKANDWLVIGAKLSSLSPNGGGDLLHLLDALSKEEYLANLHDDGSVYVTFSDKATGKDMLQGMFHAHVLRHYQHLRGNHEAVKLSLQTVEVQMPKLLEELQAKGWKLGNESFIIEPSEAMRYSLNWQNDCS